MPSFTAHLCCPLCPWGTVASAPTYGEAEARVSAQLLAHLDAHHPEASRAKPEVPPASTAA